MSDPVTEVEGLLPWVQSCDLADILGVIAIWYEASEDGAEIGMKLRPWEVHLGRPDLHLRPCLTIDLTYGDKGYRGMGELKAWKGARPEDVRPALDELLLHCKAANAQRKARGSLTHVPPARMELPRP